VRRVRLLRIVLVAIVVGIIATVGIYIGLVPSTGPAVANNEPVDGPSVELVSRVPDDGAVALPDEGEMPVDVPAADVLGVGSGVSLKRFEGAAQRVQFTADEIVELDDSTLARGNVRIATLGSDGHAYVLTADEAKTGKAQTLFRAEGNVAIRRDDGMVLHADWAEHYEREKLEVAAGSVRAAFDGRRMACERAEYKHQDDLYRLHDGVTLFEAGRDGALIGADFLRLDRADGRVRLRGGVSIARGPLAIYADRMEVETTDGDLEIVRLRSQRHRSMVVEWWGDAGDPCSDAKLTLMRTSGLDIRFDDDGNPVRLAPHPPSGGVHIEARRPPDLESHMYARHMVAELTADGRLETVSGRAVVWRREPSGDESEAQLTARRAIAHFDRGDLERVDFPSGVELLRDGSVLAGGLGAWHDGNMVVERKPSLESGRMTLTAERIEVRTDIGELIADGNVMTVERSSEGSELPIKIRAQHMETQNGGERVVYRDGAHAWRGEHFLSAYEIARLSRRQECRGKRRPGRAR